MLWSAFSLFYIPQSSHGNDLFQTLTDLNDYITPSQACIKPLEQSNAPNVRTPGDAAVCADLSQDTYDLLGVEYDHADRDPD